MTQFKAGQEVHAWRLQVQDKKHGIHLENGKTTQVEMDEFEKDCFKEAPDASPGATRRPAHEPRTRKKPQRQIKRRLAWKLHP
jgi:hypothetical protein